MATWKKQLSALGPHLKEVEIALFRDLVAFLVFLAGNAFQDTFHCLTATSTEGVARYGEDHWDKRNLTLIILMARYNTTYSFAQKKMVPFIIATSL